MQLLPKAKADGAKGEAHNDDPKSISVEEPMGVEAGDRVVERIDTGREAVALWKQAQSLLPTCILSLRQWEALVGSAQTATSIDDLDTGKETSKASEPVEAISKI